MQVLENQFVLTSKSALTPAFRDLAVGTLTLVPHTPITALGLNFMGHYRLATEAEYHKVGDVLAPKKIWKELFPDENDSPGIGDLTIRIQHAPRSRLPTVGDETRISLQASSKLPYAVFLSYNDHREIAEDRDRAVAAAERAVEIIGGDWESAREDALRVFDGLISKALETRDA